MWVGAALGAELPLADSVATGDCAAVVSRLAASSDLHAAERLAGAHCHLELDDPTEALKLLTGDLGVLQGYGHWLTAEAHFALGNPADAMTTLANAKVPAPLRPRVEMLRGRAELATGESGGDARLRKLTRGDTEPEARLWLAEAAGVAGDVDALVAGLIEVWVDGRPGGWDVEATERLTSLKRLPDPTTDSGEVHARGRLANLQKHGRNTEALALALVLQAKAPPTTEAQWRALGDAHWRAREYAGALEAWRHVYGPPEEAVHTDVAGLFDYALCHARAGDYDTAAVVYRRVMAQHPGTKQADLASYKLGYMEYDRRDCDAAVPLFDAHITALPTSRHLDEALWFSARCAWRTDDPQTARGHWDRLTRDRPKSSLVPGAAYWSARAAGRGGDLDGEKKSLRSVVSRWPTSGYAWFAAARLHMTFAPKAAVGPPPWPGAMAQLPAVARADALLAVGLRSWARAELESVKPSGGRAGTLALAWARIRAGDYRGGKRLACPLAESPWKADDPIAQQACTPRPEASVVDAQRRGSALDPAIPYGVMLAESALQAEVTSIAGARGLMQLMPELGAELHPRVFSSRTYDPDDLYSAPYNVALGTLELVDRTTALSDVLAVTSVPAVVASYNGGEEAVRRWLEPFDQPPPFDDWSEDVGYTETRRYIKHVLGFAMAYRWVYGDPE